MADPRVYGAKLSAFSRMLRLEGLAAGPRETEDACRILIRFGLEDRELVKTALRTVYAKSLEEQGIFDRVFDGFFLSEEAMRQLAREQAENDRRLEENRRQAQQDLTLNGRPMNLSDTQREVYATMPEEMREKLRSFMDRYRQNAERNQDLYNNFIHSVFQKTLMEQQIKMEDAAVGCTSMDPEVGILYRDISQFQDHEIPKAIDTIQKIARQINSELSAKRKNRGRSDKLDFRRTIRKALETGGTFHRLRYRKKRQRKKHLVLLCDVSGSMVQFSEFALRFIQSLNNTSDSSRVFLFSEDMVEADPFSLQNMDLFRTYVKESGIYGRGTDLGSALEALCALRPAVLGESTTLLILSDTKTVDQPRAIRALVQAKHLAGQILWLNPIPENRWEYLKSAKGISSICTMLSCNTLHALTAACKRLAKM